MKLTATLLLLFTLTGCMSGKVEHIPMLDEKGNPIFSKYRGKPLIKKVKVSRSTATMQETSKQVESASKLGIKEAELKIAQIESRKIECSEYTPEQVAALTKEGEVAYLNSVDKCSERAMFMSMLSILSNALDKALDGDSDIQTVAKVGGQTAVGIESEITERITVGLSSGANLGGKLGLYRVSESVFSGAFSNAGDRNITVGDITSTSDQYNGAQSNDAMASSGELGNGTATGTGTSTNTRSDVSPTNINIGGSLNNAVATDDAGSLSGTTNSGLLEPSSTGAFNTDSNVDYQPVIDDNQPTDSPQTNSPQQGSENELF